MDGRILVTGATGNVGSEVARLLHAQEQSGVAAVSSPARATALPDAMPWVTLNFKDPATFPAAFQGIDRLFLMRPPAINNVAQDIQPLIHYATQAGVRQIVFLSLLGAEKNKIVPHAKIEELLTASPVPWTFLRAGFFAQNLSTTHLAEIRDRGEIFIPAGRGKTAFLDVRDIAAVAVKVLTETGHERQAYPLTGAAAYDYFEVAALLSEILGRTIRYMNPSPLRFAWQMHCQGKTWGYVGVVTAIYLTTRFGMAAQVTPHIADLLGRAPISLRQFVEDHADLWRATSPEAA